MDLPFCGTRRPVVTVYVADRGREDVDAGGDEFIDIFGRREERCSENELSISMAMWCCKAPLTFQVARVCNTIFSTVYPPTLSLHGNTLRMALFCQAFCLLEVFGLVVMRHVHHYRINWECCDDLANLLFVLRMIDM